MILDAFSSIDVLQVHVENGVLHLVTPNGAEDVVTALDTPMDAQALVSELADVSDMLQDNVVQTLPPFLYRLVDDGVLDLTFVNKNGEHFFRVQNPNTQTSLDLSAQDVESLRQEISALYETQGPIFTGNELKSRPKSI